MNRFAYIFSLLCIVALSASARADSLYTYVTGTNTYTIDIPTNSPITVSGVASFNVTASVTLNGNTTNDLLTFSSSTASGGFVDLTKGIDVYGAQLFTGSITAPTFATGTFAMYADVNLLTQVGTLTCNQSSPVPTAITPEPSGLVLLGTGLIGAAAAARRRTFAALRNRMA